MENTLPAAKSGNTRLPYLDHLRVSLVILVILHHVAVVYGAAAPFYYVEPPFTDPRAFQVLLVFVLANQSFFMGALFLLAGFFVPGSFDRKSTGAFLRDKLLRLGIPLVVFIFVLNPVSSVGFYLMPAAITGITTPLTWQEYPKLIGLGPLWFVALLLVFNLGYVALRLLLRKRPGHSKKSPSRPGYLGIGLFILGLAAATYLLRMEIPIGRSLLDLPSLAYLPQYLSFFVLGAVAYRRDWFKTLPVSRGIAGIGIAAVVSVVLFPLAISGQMFSLAVGPTLNNAMGEGHWQSAIYAVWDSTFAVGMSLALITLYGRLFNRQGKLGALLARNSYTVYIIHTPTIIYLAYALRGMELASLLKFAVVSIIAVPVCFAVAYLIRKIPGTSRVL